MVPPRRGHVSAAQRHTVPVRSRCHRRCAADVHLMDSQTRLSVWNALRTKTVHHRSRTNLRMTPSHSRLSPAVMRDVTVISLSLSCS